MFGEYKKGDFVHCEGSLGRIEEAPKSCAEFLVQWADGNQSWTWAGEVMDVPDDTTMQELWKAISIPSLPGDPRPDRPGDDDPEVL
jgi:hypothetical protein